MGKKVSNLDILKIIKSSKANVTIKKLSIMLNYTYGGIFNKVKTLKADGYITSDEHGNISLTDSGLKLLEISKVEGKPLSQVETVTGDTGGTGNAGDVGDAGDAGDTAIIDTETLESIKAESDYLSRKKRVGIMNEDSSDDDETSEYTCDDSTEPKQTNSQNLMGSGGGSAVKLDLSNPDHGIRFLKDQETLKRIDTLMSLSRDYDTREIKELFKQLAVKIFEHNLK